MSAVPADTLSLGALFLLGLLGSGHCVGMCGPLVLAFPGRVGGLGAQLAYGLGRIATYTLVGIALGSLGAGLGAAGGVAGDPLLWTARAQLGLSVLAAVFLALFGLTRLGLMREPGFLSLANPARLPGFRSLQTRLAGASAQPPAARSRSSGALFSLAALGLLLGLLPCGLSYAAFARSLASGGALWGGLMALAFGLGTLPALVSVGLTASRWSVRSRKASDLIAGALMIAMAASLIVDLL
jgi:sulfite exporter TauE/SafE